MRITKTKDTMTASLNKIERQLKEIPRKAYDYWVSITPIDTGNARKRTRLKNNSTIHADYPYAVRLDKGWSRQFGRKGMSRPTAEFIRRLLKKIRK